MSEIRVTDIKGENGLDAVNFSKGVSAAGIVTATGFKVGTGISMTDTGIKASNFYGSGAALTGIAGGKIAQVVTQVYEPGSDINTSSTSFQDTSMTLQITPSNTNSKIFIFGIANGFKISNADSNAIINIKRAVSGGSTDNLAGQNYGVAHTYETNATTSPIFFVDGTTGTAQRTYTVVFRTDNGSRQVQIFRGSTSNMFMLAEILP